MRKSAIRLLALATLSFALVGAPVITTVYANPDSDAPAPAPTKGKKKKSSERRRSLNRPAMTLPHSRCLFVSKPKNV